jgi:para-aminobenzoate synthetase/4-amino-4-deoxychorismate lyase
MLDALAAAVAPDVPLLVDLDGHVLETARASVVARMLGGELVTPPLDGRILPSVTSARLLEAAPAIGPAVRVRPLPLAELATAREILLVGALRLVEPVAALDGARVPEVDALAQVLRAQLEPRPA